MIYKILNLIMFAVMVLMNYLANSLPINGKTTGQLSDQYSNLFVPAGITFSIWGVIYLILLIFIVVQFRESNREMVQQIGWFFAISCAFNGLWIVAWHYESLPISLLLMLGLLAALIVINYRIIPLPSGITKAAFGIYLGWICIATIANVTALLVKEGWGGWGIAPSSWAIIMIAIGVVITSLALVKLSNPFIGLAVMWAFIGIVLKRQSDFQSIVIAAIIGITVVGVFTITMFVKGKLPITS
jgi:hypothetical protein